MYRIKIKMDNADDARRLVDILNEFPMDIDAKRGHVEVDAKSLIAMLSLVHISELTLAIHSKDAESVVKILKQERFLEAA